MGDASEIDPTTTYDMTKEIKVVVYDDNDEPYDVTIEFTPGRPCTRFEYGAPMEPDDPDEYNIVDCIDATGNSINWEAIPGLEDRALDAAWDYVTES